MGIRRRRKKLTSLLSDTERRIRATTLRKVRRKPAPTAADVKEETETTAPTPPPVGTTISVLPPDQWAKIIGGRYYPPKRTGGLGQVELFLNENLSLSAGEVLYVSGIEISWNQTSGGQTFSGSFTPNTSKTATNQRVVLKYGNPDWTGRGASTKPKYEPIPDGVTNSIIYTVVNKSEIPNGPTGIAISFRAQVASYFASTTATGIINFTAAHHFVAGQILDISDLPAPFRDVDGIIEVFSVPSSTQISFKFSKPLSSTIASTTPSTTSYVNAAVSKFTAVGSTWIDSSTTPNKVWIWDELRWTGYTDALAEGLVVDDGIAPAPPTSLSLSSVGYLEAGPLGKVSKSSATLSWASPNTNASGGPLNDLAGYRIWYSTQSATGPWIGKENFGQETTQTIVNLSPQITYYFRVIAFDTSGRDSTGLDGEIETEKAALSVQKPSAPVATARLGTVKIVWDGKDYEDEDTPLELLAFVEVHSSTSSGFTPGPTTLIGKLYGGAGFLVATELIYNTDYYFKFVAVDVNKRATDASAQATARVVPLVNTDLIAAQLNSPLSVWPFAPAAVTAGALAAGAIDASAMFGPGVVEAPAIAAQAIGTDQLAANAVTAGKIEANTITSAQIAALTIEAGNIKGNTITADKMDVGYIYAGAISAGQITTGSLSGDRISGGTITGTIINSASFGQRVVINSSTADFYNSLSQLTGSVYGTSGSIVMTSPNGSASLTIFTSGGGADLFVVGGGYFGASTDGVIIGANSKRTFFQDPNIQMPFITDSTQSANVRWGATFNGRLFYISSARRAKYDIQDADVTLEALQLRPRTWFDKNEYIENGNSTEGLVRIPGFVAEEVLEAGLEEFVVYNQQGEVQGLSYDRMVASIVPVIKYHNGLIIQLQTEIAALKGD